MNSIYRLIQPQRFGYTALAIWFLACLWQAMSFVMAGLIGSASGGNTGAYIFTAGSLVGIVLYTIGIVVSLIGLKRDSKKAFAWISLGLQAFFLLLTITLVVGGFVIRF